MTPARMRQIRQFQAAGAKARKNSNPIKRWSASELAAPRKKVVGFPTGKISLLVHRTSVAAANALVREQKWKPNNKLNMDPPGKGTVFFSPPRATSLYTNRGNAIVAVRVPRKLVKRSGIGTDLYVKEQDLTGRKIRRIK